jgi:hypothetical protein
MVADKLHTAGWSWGYCCAVLPVMAWRWIVDAHLERSPLHCAFGRTTERVSGVGSDIAVIAGKFASTNGARFVKKQPSIKQDLNQAGAFPPGNSLPFRFAVPTINNREKEQSLYV